MEETHTLNTCACVCVCRSVGNGLQRGNMGTRSWWDFDFCLRSLTLDGRVWDERLGLVIDLQLGGMLYVIFSLQTCPPPPSRNPTSPPSPLPVQVTQSPRCTQGVVITGAAEIGQDKGALPAQDVFPPFFSFFLFSRTNHFPSPHSPPAFFYLMSSNS